MANLEIKDLSFSYDRKHYALNGINLVSDMEGGILSILGPNGAGKTTLVNILTTTFKLQKGKVNIFGLDIKKDKKKIRNQISLCAQDLELDVLLSLKTNLKFYGMIRGFSKQYLEKRIEEILELFDLKEHQNKKILELSGGLMRRVQLARSFLDLNAKLIFIDEPTLGLDPVGKKVTWDLIKEMSDDGYYFILTTNDMAEVESLANEIVFIDNGKIITYTTLKDFKNSYAGNVIITFQKGILPDIKKSIDRYIKNTGIGRWLEENILELKDRNSFYDFLLEAREMEIDFTHTEIKEETLFEGFIKLIRGGKT